VPLQAIGICRHERVQARVVKALADVATEHGFADRRALGSIATSAYHAVMSDRTEGDRATRGAWTEIENARDAAARRAAVRRAHALGPGANIEEAIRLIRAGEAMHGAARR
jgi:hypothetical protein